MARYAEMTEEQREKAREYQRKYKQKDPEKYKKSIKNGQLSTFFKFYNNCKNKERAFITKDMAEMLKISIKYCVEVFTSAKKENLITPIGKQSCSIMYHFNKERIENMNNIKTEPTNGKIVKIEESQLKHIAEVNSFLQEKVLTFEDEILMAVSKGIAGVFNAKLTQMKEEATNEALKLVDNTLKENEELKKEISNLKSLANQSRGFTEERMKFQEQSKKDASEILELKSQINDITAKCQRLSEENRKQSEYIKMMDSEKQKAIDKERARSDEQLTRLRRSEEEQIRRVNEIKKKLQNAHDIINTEKKEKSALEEKVKNLQRKIRAFLEEENECELVKN